MRRFPMAEMEQALCNFPPMGRKEREERWGCELSHHALNTSVILFTTAVVRPSSGCTLESYSSRVSTCNGPIGYLPKCKWLCLYFLTVIFEFRASRFICTPLESKMILRLCGWRGPMSVVAGRQAIGFALPCKAVPGRRVLAIRRSICCCVES